MRFWYNESSHFNFNQSKFSYKTAQFTQVIWKDTKQLGIAWATSNDGNIYIVANYSPAGNIRKDFSENVLPPFVTSLNDVDGENARETDDESDASDLEGD